MILRLVTRLETELEHETKAKAEVIRLGQEIMHVRKDNAALQKQIAAGPAESKLRDLEAARAELFETVKRLLKSRDDLSETRSALARERRILDFIIGHHSEAEDRKSEEDDSEDESEDDE